MLDSQGLLNFIDQDTLDRFIQSFSAATGIAVDINDIHGYPIAAFRNYDTFCHTIRSSPQGLERCFRSNAQVGYEAASTNAPVIRRCHAGLTLIGAPIIIDDRYTGSIVCGQFHSRHPEEQDIREMMAAVGEIVSSPGDLAAAFRSVEVISPEKCHAACDLVQLIAGYIAGIIQKAAIQDELNREKLKAVEEAKARIELENALRVAELRGLQSQIRPHFLFNTFNIITRLITLGDTSKALDVTYALSGLLRYHLEQPAELIPLRKEMVHVNNYLLVQCTRFGRRLSVHLDIPDEVLEAPIPPLTVQPLVENACFHGIEPKEGPGNLYIKGNITGNKSVIEISDDGVGIPAEIIKAFTALKQNPEEQGVNRATGRVGLWNVHRRLQLHFGTEYGLDLATLPRGTRVTVTLPAPGAFHRTR